MVAHTYTHLHLKHNFNFLHLHLQNKTVDIIWKAMKTRGQCREEQEKRALRKKQRRKELPKTIETETTIGTTKSDLHLSTFKKKQSTSDDYDHPASSVSVDSKNNTEKQRLLPVWLDLPNDIWIYILKLLPFEEKRVMRLVNRYFWYGGSQSIVSRSLDPTRDFILWTHIENLYQAKTLRTVFPNAGFSFSSWSVEYFEYSGRTIHEANIMEMLKPMDYVTLITRNISRFSALSRATFVEIQLCRGQNRIDLSEFANVQQLHLTTDSFEYYNTFNYDYEDNVVDEDKKWKTSCLTKATVLLLRYPNPIDSLQPLTQLRALCIGMDNHIVEVPKELVCLEHLLLQSCKKLKHIAHLPNLKQLIINGHMQELSVIPSFPCLTFFSLENNTTIKTLSCSPLLETIVAKFCVLESIPDDLVSLSTLVLLGARKIKHIPFLPNLKRLNIRFTNIDTLPPLPSLVYLEAFDSKIEPYAKFKESMYPKLKHVNLCDRNRLFDEMETGSEVQIADWPFISGRQLYAFGSVMFPLVRQTQSYFVPQPFVKTKTKKRIIDEDNDVDDDEKEEEEEE